MTLKSGGGGGGSATTSYAAAVDDPRADADLAAYLDAKNDKLQPEGTIASAGTTDIGTVSSEQISVTGTTTITSLGTSAAGTRKILRFGGILALTYNATSLILPGTATITTAVNDRAMFLSLGSGNWICLWYQRANGQLVIPQVNAGQTQDVTAVTYNTDGSIATYTMNGYTWTMAYNANGTPNTETSGTLVKTYTYNGSGQFTGITGAINAGETKICTIATLPSVANNGPGDRVFVTDVRKIIMAGVDRGNLGKMFEYVGASGAGEWWPIGSFAWYQNIGSIASPLATLTGTLGATTNFSVSASVPGGVLKVGSKVRFKAHVRKTGTASATQQILYKIGQNNTTADTTVKNPSITSAVLTQMVDLEMWVTSTTTALVIGIVPNQAGDLDTAIVSLTGLNLANPIYFNAAGTTSLTTPDTLNLLTIEAHHIG